MVKHKTTRTRHWRAWAGTSQDLERIGQVTKKLFESRKKSYFDKVAEDDKRLKEEHEKAGWPGISGRNYPRANFAASITHGPDSSEGGVVEVLKELDRRTVSKVVFKGSLGGFHADESIIVSLTWNSRGDNFAGVLLIVESSDLGWANEAVATLSGEIDKGLPAWKWIHHHLLRTAVLVPYALINYYLVTWIARSAAGLKWNDPINFSGPPSLLAWWIGGTVLVTVGINVLFLSNSVFHWFFPPIEIRGDGQDSSTLRRVGILFSPLITILLGVIVNLIS